jgi:hypothetical protein
MVTALIKFNTLPSNASIETFQASVKAVKEIKHHTDLYMIPSID